MPRRVKPVRRTIEDNVVEFLSELARYLLAAGLSSARFCDLARLAFFNAGAAEGRFGNKRINQSAIAAMTGLTRVQVRAFAKQDKPQPPKTKDRLDHLMDGWSSDPGFSIGGTIPRNLRFAGSGKTFCALVAKYGGDVPPRAVLRQLQRYGYASINTGKVCLNRSARQTRSEQRLRRTAKMLKELIRADASEMEARSSVRALNLEVTFPATSDKGRLVLQRRVSESLNAFMSNVQAAGSAAAIESPPVASQKTGTTRARVAFAMEDFASQQTRKSKRKVKDDQ